MPPPGGSDLSAPLLHRMSSIEAAFLAAGFGRFQRYQIAAVIGPYAFCGATLLLPNFLLPRIRDAWPEFTEAAASVSTSLFFVGNTAGLMVWGIESVQRPRQNSFARASGLSTPSCG